MTQPSLDLGERLRAFRVRQRLKQDAVAFDLGVSQATVSRLEAGVGETSPELRARIETMLAEPENLSTFEVWLTAMSRFSGLFALYQRRGQGCVRIKTSGALERWESERYELRDALSTHVEADLNAGGFDLCPIRDGSRQCEIRLANQLIALSYFPLHDEHTRRYALVEVTPQDVAA